MSRCLCRRCIQNIYIHVDPYCPPPSSIYKYISSSSMIYILYTLPRTPGKIISRCIRLSSIKYATLGPGERLSQSGRWSGCLGQLAVRLGYCEICLAAARWWPLPVRVAANSREQAPKVVPKVRDVVPGMLTKVSGRVPTVVAKLVGRHA